MAGKGARLALEHHRLVLRTLKHQLVAASCDTRLVQAESDLRAMDHSGSDQDRALNEKIQEVDEIKTKTAQLAAKAKVLKANTETMMAESSEPVTKEAQRRRQEADPDLEQLQKEQEELEAKLACTVTISSVILEQYESRKREVRQPRALSALCDPS